MNKLSLSIKSWLSIILLILLFSCQSGEFKAGKFTDGELQQLKSREYIVGPGDEIKINIFGEEELSGEFVINNTGILSLPLVGEVKVGGLTLKQLRELIGRHYANGYLKNPNVSAEVLNYRPYYILGEINKPGEYPFSSDTLTVFKAVAIAEGFTTRAENRKVRIKHAGKDYEREYSLVNDIPVQPGDTIRILERYF